MSEWTNIAEPEREAKRDIQNTMSALMPELTPFWRRPLRDLAIAAYQFQPCTPSPIRLEARRRLQNRVETAALRAGYDASSARSAAQQLGSAPILQTGPHCLLLVHPDAFFTHIFSVMGLAATSLSWHIWYSSSTVKLIESAKNGPGWLTLQGEALNLFNLPRSRMDKYSVCGLYDRPVAFEGLSRAAGPLAKADAQALAQVLPTHAFPSAAEAIKAGNWKLWRHAFPADISLLQLDDFDIADLMADHLEDSSSWLSRRFFGEAGSAEAFLRALAELDRTCWSGWLKASTDFFWSLSDGSIYPLRLRGRVLAPRSGEDPAIRFEPSALAQALRERKLVPNLIMAFLLIAILPGIRVLGGSRQIIYYPLIRYLLTSVLDLERDHVLLQDMAADDRPGLWGHRLLMPAGIVPSTAIRRGSIGTLIEILAELPLDEACGSLQRFVSDPLWNALGNSLRTGRITTGSPEWRWANGA